MFNTNLNISIVLIFIIIVRGNTETCSDEQNYPFYNAQEGYTCRKCPAGHFLVQECSINYTNSTCLPCQPNTFTPCNNVDGKCKQCRPECPGNHRPDDEQRQFISEKCTATSDIVCSCVHGYWKEPVAHGECRTISTCSVGEGVAKLASSFADTLCVVCINGTSFSDHSSSKEMCKNCTVCQENEVAYQPCFPMSNTVCKPVSSRDDGFQSPSKTYNIWLVVGIVVGIAVFVGIVIGTAFCLKRKYKCYKRYLRTMTKDCSGRETETEVDDIERNIWNQKIPWPATKLSDKQLMEIATMIGNEWKVLAIQLGVTGADVSKIQENNKYSANAQVFDALVTWRNMTENPTLQSLYQTMTLDHVKSNVTIEWEKLHSLIKAISICKESQV